MSAPDLTRSQWQSVLEFAGGETVGDIVKALRESENISVDDPDDCVSKALETGPLTEDQDAGMFGRVHLEDNDTDTDTEEHEHESESESTTEPETGDVSKFRRVYLRAADLAGREPWEYVEESAVRTALESIGFAELLDNGTLFDIREWKYVDLSDDDEDPRRRWYCTSENEPRPAEFKRFDSLLTDRAPDGYEPHYFRVRAASKAPATRFGKWKTDDARLTVEEAVEWMEQGGNVGIAGRGGCRECGGSGTTDEGPCTDCDGSGENPEHNGPLVNIDIDDDEETTPEDLPGTLRAHSRSRTGWHAWGFNTEQDIPNIPTDSYGEIRTNWQYVVAPGSFVASLGEEIPDDATNPGYYTVATDTPVARMDYDDLPEVFQEVAESESESEEAESETESESVAEHSSENGHDHRHDGFSYDGDDDDNSAQSDVFDIDADDLVSGSKDSSARFSSIFHDSKTGSNMSVSDGKVHCWRHTVAHGGLQALCVLSNVAQVSTYSCQDIGKPHKNSKAGANKLKGDWRLIWGAWHYAKQNGHIPDSDPIPYRVLRELAVDDGLVAREELVERDTETGEVVTDVADDEGDESGTYTALPPETYNDALTHIEDTYGVAPGREPVAATGEKTAALPLEMLESLDLAEARRFASKHGIEWATTREARERLRNEVFEVMRHGDTKVIDAPTALGKSYLSAAEPWIRRGSTTGGSPVIHTHETKKARDQAAETSANADVDYAVLEGRTEACPVAAGEYDPLGREGTVDDFDRENLPETVITMDGTPASEWFENVCEDRGLPFSVAHKYLENHTDQDTDLPCCAGDNEECPAITQWDGLPRTDEGAPAVDVIHCTHQFAHVPSLRNGTNLIFDERPDFREDLTTQQVRETISAYLTVSGAPVTTFEEFTTRALNGDTKRNEHAQHATIQDAFEYQPDREWYLETDGAHTLAPALTRAVYYALKPDAECEDAHSAQDQNGRYSATVPHEPPRLDANASDESGWNRAYVSVTLNETNTGLSVETVRNTPSLNGARSVIGLDAHPAQTQWELNVHPEIETSAVLDPEERALWRRFERGLLTVGVGEATRPFTSDEYFDRDASAAFFAALREQFGEDFRTAITAASVEAQTQEILRDVGVENPDTMHYGEEKSRNDFGGEDIGALNGCIDPGDDFVLNLLAERGLEATPEMTENADGEPERAHGRGFVGPDADAAAELLASVREQHVSQSAGRYARNADDHDDRAIVFVRTDAAPAGFLDMQVPGVEWLATECQQEIIDTLTQRKCATTRAVSEEVGCSKEHARKTLRRLHDRGIVDVHENAGDHGAHLYRVLAGIDANATRPNEHVDLSPDDETANKVVWGYSTWSLAVCSVTPSGSVMNTGASTETTAGSDATAGTEPVDATGPPG